MFYRSLLGAMALVALSIPSASAQIYDNSKYPDWSGQWRWVPDGDVPRYDHTKPIRRQQAPLTPEYQARFEASIKDQDSGGFGLDTNYACIPQTMPRLMNGIVPFEFLVSPEVTHVLFERMNYQGRRIYTDGRQWPKNLDLISTGYSIGQWLDTDGDGRFDTLAVETRSVRGPKTWDQSGMPMADDNETIVMERLYLDKNDPNILHNEMTTIDNSLTRPWSAITDYHRNPSVVWREDACLANPYVTIDKQVYMLSADGRLMPLKKNQSPPDLSYFKSTAKRP
jgi:hypothetical protein